MGTGSRKKNNNYGDFGFVDNTEVNGDLKHPKSILSYQKPHPSKAIHRTEKPVVLIEWIIKTYSNEGAVVLDNTAGSFTLAEACINTNRDFIVIEKAPEDFKIGCDRIDKVFSGLFIPKTAPMIIRYATHNTWSPIRLTTNSNRL